MHVTKRKARNLAWSDSNNPFAKRHIQRRDTSSDPEIVGTRPARRVNTDDPQDYRTSTERPDDFNAASSPATVSRRRGQEPGDHVEIVRVDGSPSSSTHALSVKSEKLTSTTSSDAPQVSREGGKFRRFFATLHATGKNRTETNESKSKLAPRFTFANQFFAIVEGGTFVYAWKYTPWLSLLYLTIPAGFVVNYTRQSPTVVFAINLVAILPSAALLSLAVEELGLRVGEIIGGLLNATFSNAAQLISSILLLRSGQVVLLRSSLLGAILSNLLFMTGIGFLFGGIGRLEQYFHRTLAQTLCCLLMLAVLSLIIPSAAHYLADMTESDIIKQSRGISVVILISYVLWLFFQLHTNRSEFDTPEQLPPKVDAARVEMDKQRMRSVLPQRFQKKLVEDTTAPTLTPTSTVTEAEEAEAATEPKLSLYVAIGATVLSLVFLWFNTDFATNSVQGMLQHAGVSQTFVGVAVLPLLSNDWNMPLLARQNRMQMLLELTIEKSMQTALAIIPIIILIGWGIGVNMTLEFNGFVIAATFAAMVMVSYVVQEGKSNWLVGALLIKVYIIISIASYFIRD